MDGTYADKQRYLEQLAGLVAEARASCRAPEVDLRNQLIALTVEFAERTAAASSEVLTPIVTRLQSLLLNNRSRSVKLLPLEAEALDLALDWLEKLVGLRHKDLPVPPSLISELLYIFDLVESSTSAETLADLVASGKQGPGEQPDLFADDPSLNPAENHLHLAADPFAEDPGLGIEFDLLQRTLDVETNLSGSGNTPPDPFAADPVFPGDDSQPE